jgi:serine/threonine protein kinase
MCHVTELMDLGSLDKVMKKGKLSPALKIKIMRDVAHGMMTLHAANIIHRDLKPENVLVKSPLEESNEDLCKVTDFGTSRAVNNLFQMTMTKGAGTPLYMAPELLQGQKHYSSSVDVYSYGIVCAVVWNDGTLPYSEYNFQNPLQMQNAVINGTRPHLSSQTPQNVQELIQCCWNSSPSSRPSFNDIIGFFSHS